MRYSISLILLVLLGCTQESVGIQPIKLTLVGSTAEVKALCGKDNVILEPYGCAKQNRSEINPGGSCEIVGIRPKGFDDHAALETLGHELWHCFHGSVHD